MIKKYEMFLLNEGISMSNEDIIEILKSLETEDNKNSKLINRLVNYTDKSGKNVLMSVVSSNNEELIDYILSFNIDLNQIVKSTGENVLFFCKSIKVFKKLYDLGANIHQITKIGRNVLIYLSGKKLFNVDLYQKLINDGVDVNKIDVNGRSVINESILNNKTLKLLIENKVNLNNSSQDNILSNLVYELNYYPNKKNNILNIFETLFKNGMLIANIEWFSKIIPINNRYNIKDKPFNIIDDFIIPLKKYMTDYFLCYIYTRICYETMWNKIDIANKLLRLGAFPKLYNKLKNNYRNHDFYDNFADYIKENPWMEDYQKFNI